ncbi:Hypothetical predicted protein [Olea europaea subsp. europaea]|uniref:Uncharacterized protein n=1 Tax=Olea europaea subsp. europaea TaxID=158383 RepID=A0A8S0QKU5_OLEEU|nr:Hypothetical predicted protein [Olea europaea subsp. europaea]
MVKTKHLALFLLFKAPFDSVQQPSVPPHPTPPSPPDEKFVVIDKFILEPDLKLKLVYK